LNAANCAACRMRAALVCAVGSACSIASMVYVLGS
jgi:hypothetical protein